MPRSKRCCVVDSRQRIILAFICIVTSIPSTTVTNGLLQSSPLSSQRSVHPSLVVAAVTRSSYSASTPTMVTEEPTAISINTTAISNRTTTAMSAQQKEYAVFLQEQAARIREEANEMDRALRESKQKALEHNLARRRINRRDDANLQNAVKSSQRQRFVSTKVANSSSTATLPFPQTTPGQQSWTPKPFTPFDKEDLQTLLPIAQSMTDSNTNNSKAEQQLQQFRNHPAVVSFLNDKLSQSILEPLQDLQQLQTLKERYLASSSTVEKKQIKRQIDVLVAKTRDRMQHDSADGTSRGNGSWLWTDPLSSSSAAEEQQQQVSRTDTTGSRICLDIPPLSQQELQDRIAHLQSYPRVLQLLFLSQYGEEANAKDDDGDDGTDLTLSILLDYYEDQLERLDHVMEKNNDSMVISSPATQQVLQNQVRRAVSTLPPSVCMYYYYAIMQEEYDDSDGDNTDESCSLIDALTSAIMEPAAEQRDPAAYPFMAPVEIEVEIMGTATNGNDHSNNNEDDRVDDLLLFADVEYLDRSRYVEEFYPSVARGLTESLSSQDVVQAVQAASGSTTAPFAMSSPPERVKGGWFVRGQTHNATAFLQAWYSNATDLAAYYILDPSPVSDEQVEFDDWYSDPILLVTRRPQAESSGTDVLAKAAVSALAFLTATMWVSMVTNDSPNAMGGILAGLMVNQLAHEFGHRAVAWRDKFGVGGPTFVPSAHLGFMGTITPLRSSPPSAKSLFDFSIAGPLVGGFVSLLMYWQGLHMETTLDCTGYLPTSLLRSSALAGGLAESVLPGSSMIIGSGTTALHPLAIAGFCGLLTNAVALLPLGNTDGGRISLTMFGRRGSYIVKTFTTALLCIAGLCGIDQIGLLLTYVIFAAIWQGNLELPLQNEVEELDFSRGLVGIVAAVVVALVLLPMQ